MLIDFKCYIDLEMLNLDIQYVANMRIRTHEKKKKAREKLRYRRAIQLPIFTIESVHKKKKIDLRIKIQTIGK